MSYQVEEPDQLAKDCVNLRWRQGFSVGLLSRVSDEALKHRYVKLADIGEALYKVETGADHVEMEWINLLASGVAIGVSSKFRVGVYVEPPVERLYVFDRHPRTPIPIKTPHLIWVGVWRQPDQQLVTTQLLCAAAPLLGLDAPVYRWPFGNVYADSHICWGSVRVDLKLSQLCSLPQRFFSSQFNRDLWEGGDELAERLHPADEPDDPDLVDVSKYVPRTTKPLQEWIRYE